MEKYYSSYAKQLQKRKGKPWQAVLRYKDAEGKAKTTSKMLPNVKGKREAYRLAEEWRKEMNEQAALAPDFDKEKTVGDVILDYLDYQLRCGEIEPSSYKIEKYAYNGCIKQYIGDISFVSLDRNAINIWLTKLNARGLSQSSIGTAYYTVRKTYDYFFRIEELTRNPFAGIKPPKKQRGKITHLNEEQMAQFIDLARKQPWQQRIAFELAFYAGLRRGEICGLRWRDINFTTGTLSVESAVSEGIGGTYTKQPKNNPSIRSFPLVEQLLEELKIYYNIIEPQQNWFVVGKEVKYYRPAALSEDFKRFVEKYKLVDVYGNHLTLHMLRHNLGTVGINSGMDIASLSRMFGHASRAMTLDTYGDASKDAMILASAKLSNQFKGKNEKEVKNPSEDKK